MIVLAPDDVIARAREALAADERVLVAYLFGSFARGRATAKSDIDVAVLFAERIDPRLGGPMDELRAAVELACHRTCDLIDGRAAPADLVHRVLRDGQLLVERDRSARIAFEVARRNEYFDLLPYLCDYRRRATCDTDHRLVAKRLAFIETCLRELRLLATPGRLRDDVRERRFVEHTLQLAIQAALDIASHIVSDDRLGEPATNRDLFETLGAAGWLPRELATRLTNMAGFRNVLVHGYTDVDIEIVEDVLANHLGELDAFVEAVRARLLA